MSFVVILSACDADADVVRMLGAVGPFAVLGEADEAAKQATDAGSPWCAKLRHGSREHQVLYDVVEMSAPGGR